MNWFIRELASTQISSFPVPKSPAYSLSSLWVSKRLIVRSWINCWFRIPSVLVGKMLSKTTKATLQWIFPFPFPDPIFSSQRLCDALLKMPLAMDHQDGVEHVQLWIIKVVLLYMNNCTLWIIKVTRKQLWDLPLHCLLPYIWFTMMHLQMSCSSTTQVQ